MVVGRVVCVFFFFFFSSRRRHTRWTGDWSSDVCSSDLGAKNHAVVLPDADMEFAANHITAAGYGSAGQRCMAISAVVAVGDAGDALVARLKEKAEEVKVGPGRDQASEMGPVVTPEARDRIKGY